MTVPPLIFLKKMHANCVSCNHLGYYSFSVPSGVGFEFVLFSQFLFEVFGDTVNFSAALYRVLPDSLLIPMYYYIEKNMKSITL